MAGIDSSSDSRENILLEKLKDGAIESLRNYYTKHRELKASFSSVDPGGGLLHRLVTRHSKDEIFMFKDGEPKTVIHAWDVKNARTAIELLPKSGIVTAITYLEEYVHDILGKLYDTLHEHLTFEELKSFWPDPFAPFLKKGNSKKLIEQMFRSAGDGKLDDYVMEMALNYKAETMNALDKPTWESVKKCLEALFGTPNSLGNIKSLMKSVLKKLRINGTLANHDSILGWRLQYETGENNKLRQKYQVIPGDEGTLEDMANFYYGMRCIFAHGNPTRTIEKGVLSQHNIQWYFQITELQSYQPEINDEQVDIIQKRYEHKSIVKSKYLGLTASKEVITVTEIRNKAEIKEVTQPMIFDVKKNKWIPATGRSERMLESFENFLTEERASIAREAVCANYEQQWVSAKKGNLAPNYSLYLSTANFSIFYANIIAVLSLAKCYSIIRGTSKTTEGSLNEILHAINTLRKETGMLMT